MIIDIGLQLWNFDFDITFERVKEIIGPFEGVNEWIFPDMIVGPEKLTDPDYDVDTFNSEQEAIEHFRG